jgi:hypothetical protein
MSTSWARQDPEFPPPTPNFAAVNYLTCLFKARRVTAPAIKTNLFWLM